MAHLFKLTHACAYLPLLPTLSIYLPPQSDSEYLNYHLTNVRDVELLTGLHFFKSLPGQVALEYRTSQTLEIWPFPEAPILSLLSDRMGKADSFAADDNTQSS